jgi:hypothetical protein
VKKFAPILLIAVLLFNVFGYYGIFVGLRLKASHELTEILDKQSYCTDETVTLKLPMSVPYQIDQEEYQNVSGEIEYHGEFYRLVKQRLANDTLYVVCFMDKQSKNIKQTFDDYAKTLSDKNDSHKSDGKLFQSLIKEYISNALTVEHGNVGWCNTLNSIFVLDTYTAVYISSAAQPPEA